MVFKFNRPITTDKVIKVGAKMQYCQVCLPVSTVYRDSSTYEKKENMIIHFIRFK